MKLSLTLKSILLVVLTSLVFTACGDKKDGDDDYSEEDYYDSQFQLTPFAKCTTTLSETFKDSLLEQTNYVGVSNLGGTIITSDLSAEELLLSKYPLKFKLNSATAFTTNSNQYPEYDSHNKIQDALDQLKAQYAINQEPVSDDQSSDNTDLDNQTQKGPKHVLVINFETSTTNRCIISVLDFKSYTDSLEYYYSSSGELKIVKISYDKSNVILE